MKLIPNVKVKECENFFFAGATAERVPGTPYFSGFYITKNGSSGQAIGTSQRPLPDSRQHSQETDNDAPWGIRTRNPSKQSAADPRLRLLGYWDRHVKIYKTKIFIEIIYLI